MAASQMLKTSFMFLQKK